MLRRVSNSFRSSLLLSGRMTCLNATGRPVRTETEAKLPLPIVTKRHSGVKSGSRISVMFAHEIKSSISWGKALVAEVLRGCAQIVFFSLDLLEL